MPTLINRHTDSGASHQLETAVCLTLRPYITETIHKTTICRWMETFWWITSEISLRRFPPPGSWCECSSRISLPTWQPPLFHLCLLYHIQLCELHHDVFYPFFTLLCQNIIINIRACNNTQPSSITKCSRKTGKTISFNFKLNKYNSRIISFIPSLTYMCIINM